VISALPLAVVAAFVREPDRGAAPAPKRVPGVAPAADGPRPPGTLRFAVLGALISGSASMLGVLFPILATEYAGLSTAQAGALFLATPFLAFTGPAFGWLADHVDQRFVLSLRSVANTLSSILFLVSPSFLGFFVGKSLDDLGKAAFKPAWGAMMAHVSGFDRRSRARILGVISMGEDAGDIVAPVVAGLLFSWQGAVALLLGRFGLAVVAEVYAHVVTKSLHDPAPGGPAARQNRYRPGGWDGGPDQDRRVHVLAGEVLAVRRHSSGGPDPALREMALRRGHGLGAEVYELEVVDSVQGPVVIGVRDDGVRRSSADLW
jgi:MFS family permease